jgi:rhamnulose-1-phosphate aldolase/alcohol dehydrogenase
MPQNLWNELEATTLSGLDLLVYRSRLLGADRSVCNVYGGNTASKIMEIDFRGRPTMTLWVKGSGSDLATMTRKDFAGLRLDDVLPLLERDAMSDEAMTAYLAHCLLQPTMPRQSIETLLHAFIPAAHTDHTHPDAIVALACAEHGEDLARELYGERIAWVPYTRPGFALSKQIANAVRAHPKLECVIMGKHGLVTWDDDPRACYDKTIRVIQAAEDFIASRRPHRSLRPVRSETTPDQRRAIATELMPLVRCAASKSGRMIARYDDSAEVLDFIAADGARELALTGAACPDHLVHTKHWPLFVEWHDDVNALKQNLSDGLAQYIAQYTQYFETHRNETDAMFNPAPRVVLIPNVGMMTLGKDAHAAQVSADLYYRALAVMRGATILDRFVSLTPAEAYGVEYWPLELYKLTLRPPERELAGRIAFVTGGASGIGRATAYRLAAEGAHVVIADINAAGAAQVADELCKQHGTKRGFALTCNVSDEAEVVEAFRQTVLAYGGVDIVVSNAGLASASPITETSVSEWNKLFDVLARGYFLVAREAFRVWQAQGLGGSLIFVASKNGLIGSKNAAAYGAAKAAEINLARCLAEEGGAHGIRVNVVNPDAVLQGSSIWSSQWREERARGAGIAPTELEEYYRQRNTLKVNIFPEDIAEAVCFFASERSAKTTGGILNVDGGLAAAYVR